MTDAGSNTSLLGLHWASRVNPILIRRLYQTDARGIVDEELIDAVGFALYARCQSILQATEAHAGRIICPECGSLVERDGGPWLKGAMLDCPQCGWQVAWEAYFKTYQHKHLVGGGAIAFHSEYIDHFKHARSPQEKMLAIDRLIHACHWELVQSPGRPAAREIIYAKNYHDLLTFLDTLSYGERSTSGLEAAKREWDRKLARSGWHRSMGFGQQTGATSPDDS
jgi:predicted RNA-binding Zn-ribbon protein involved in translation (DUF1610 family)